MKQERLALKHGSGTVESESIIASPVELTWKEDQYILRFVVDYDSWHEAESQRFDVKKTDSILYLVPLCHVYAIALFFGLLGKPYCVS